MKETTGEKQNTFHFIVTKTVFCRHVCYLCRVMIANGWWLYRLKIANYVFAVDEALSESIVEPWNW